MKFNKLQRAYIVALAAFQTANAQVLNEFENDSELQNIKNILSNRKKSDMKKVYLENLIHKMSDKEVEIESKYQKWELHSLLIEAGNLVAASFKDSMLKLSDLPKYNEVKLMLENYDKVMINMKFRQKFIDIAMKYKGEI